MLIHSLNSLSSDLEFDKTSFWVKKSVIEIGLQTKDRTEQVLRLTKHYQVSDWISCLVMEIKMLIS
jgi:hypothetical protein